MYGLVGDVSNPERQGVKAGLVLVVGFLNPGHPLNFSHYLGKLVVDIRSRLRLLHCHSQDRMITIRSVNTVTAPRNPGTRSGVMC